MPYIQKRLYVWVVPLLLAASPVAADEGEQLLAKFMKAVPEECEETSSILAEVRVRKFERALSTAGSPMTKAQREAVYAVTKDQCIAVRFVQMLRMLRSSIPMAEWSKLRGDEQINEMLARIERTL